MFSLKAFKCDYLTKASNQLLLFHIEVMFFSTEK